MVTLNDSMKAATLADILASPYVIQGECNIILHI